MLQVSRNITQSGAEVGQAPERSTLTELSQNFSSLVLPRITNIDAARTLVPVPSSIRSALLTESNDSESSVLDSKRASHTGSTLLNSLRSRGSAV